MNKEDLSIAIGLINDDIIEQTENKRIINKRYKVMRITRACVAACLAIVVTASAVLLYPKLRNNNTVVQQPKPNIDITPIAPEHKPDVNDLPTIEISENFGAAGFEAYMAHDISELVNSNPWSSDSDIKTLPVYQNTLNLNERYEITNIDKEKMNQLILDVAKRLGLKENEFEITTDSRIYKDDLFVKTQNFQIRVEPELTATIEFEPVIAIPKKYNFSYFANYEDTLASAKYLKNEYSDIISFKSPKINITLGDYNTYNQQHYEIEFFDESGDITQDIINYNFNKVTFYSLSEKENTLSMIRIFQTDLSKKIGDYPIIALEKAEELLKNKNFISSVPSSYEMKAENVKKVELIYRNVYWMDKIYLPYYKFYVELPELENRFGHGLKHYGIYYVPAVDGKYIKNMPVYNGNLN